jgi:hypothetical protein
MLTVFRMYDAQELYIIASGAFKAVVLKGWFQNQQQ